jgi:hypothetical protein
MAAPSRSRSAWPWPATSPPIPAAFAPPPTRWGPGRQSPTWRCRRRWAAGFDEFLLAVATEVSLASDGLAEDDAERLAEITMAPENRPMLENNARPVGAAEVAKLARALLTAS